MPSPGEDIQSWSVTAIDNGTADPLINWVEGQTRASVNNSSRSELAAHAKNRNLNNGSIVTTGSRNAQAFLSGVGYTSIPTGLRAMLKVGSGLTNDDALTLNMDGIGTVEVKDQAGVSLNGNEFVGDSYVEVLYNGTNWILLYSQQFIDYQLHGGGGVIIGFQKFPIAGSYTYTPSAGTECVIVECIGGGGSGGAALAPNPGWMCGGGGGSGGYSRSVLTAAQIGGSQTVTVGVGGGGWNGAGQPGTASSFGSLVVANGGSGGLVSAMGQQLGQAGAGGVIGTGDIVAAGAPGEAGFYNDVDGNHIGTFGGGGSSAFGGGGSTANLGAGLAGGNYGGGGSGGVSANGGGVGAGGSGASGVVFITEFAGRGAPGEDGADGPQGPVGPAGPAGAGTGDVLVSGTPVVGQFAQWTDTSHIKGSTSAPAIISGTPAAGQMAQWVNASTIKGVTGVPGTTTNDNAAAGYVGEYVEATKAAGAATFVVTDTFTNVTSNITLTAGDWDVWGVVHATYLNTNIPVHLFGYLSTTSAGGGTSDPLSAARLVLPNTGSPFGSVSLGPLRVKVINGATQDMFLVVYASFGGVGTQTCQVYGQIRARRVR